MKRDNFIFLVRVYYCPVLLLWLLLLCYFIIIIRAAATFSCSNIQHKNKEIVTLTIELFFFIFFSSYFSCILEVFVCLLTKTKKK